MTQKDIISNLVDMMELEEGDLSVDSALADFDEWDSISKLSLIAFAKKEYGKKLVSDDIHKFIIVQDIIDWLER